MSALFSSSTNLLWEEKCFKKHCTVVKSLEHNVIRVHIISFIMRMYFFQTNLRIKLCVYVFKGMFFFKNCTCRCLHKILSQIVSMLSASNMVFKKAQLTYKKPIVRLRF